MCNATRYLGYILSLLVCRNCSFRHSKIAVYRSFNAIFGKVGRIAILMKLRNDETLKEAVWRDSQNISIFVELTVCQKNVTNALNSIGIMLENKL